MKIHSTESLHAKRLARVFWRMADEKANEPMPWAIRNHRVYCDLAIGAERKRTAILRAYLDKRRERG